MASQIIELSVSTKRNGKFAKVRRRFRKESSTYSDRSTTEEVKSHKVLAKRLPEARNGKPNNYSANASPFGSSSLRSNVVSLTRLNYPFQQNETVSSLKSVVDSARNRRRTVIDQQQKKLSLIRF